MNKQEQRIAIAEACGWHDCQLIKSYEGAQIPYGLSPNDSPILREAPDYCNDLNAMHEAEKVLGEPLCYDYVDRLPQHYEGRTNFARAHATAAQRSEAFLKTIGKWEKSK